MTPLQTAGTELHPYTFRLPEALMARIDACLEGFRRAGLTVSRENVVRFLLTRALESMEAPRASSLDLDRGEPGAASPVSRVTRRRGAASEPQPEGHTH